MTRKVVHSDPAFADEMAQLAAARAEEAEAKSAEFREAWRQRLERGVLPPLPPTKLHHHEADCWEDPQKLMILGVRLTVHRCTKTGVLEEVE